MPVVKDNENVFDGRFKIMALSHDEEEEEKVSMVDLKQNLNANSIRRLRSLVVVLID